MRRLRSITLVLALVLGLTGCRPSNVSAGGGQEARQFIAMDTVMTLSLCGEDQADVLPAAEDLIRSLEAKLSRTEENSAVSRLNRGRWWNRTRI